VLEARNISLAWLIPPTSNQNAGKTGISVGGMSLLAEPIEGGLL